MGKNIKENICKECTFYTKDCRCNRLVMTCIGMNDRVASYYKKNNNCDYFEKGNTSKDIIVGNINFYNS